MMISPFAIKTREQPGPDIRFNCPKCGGSGIPGATRDYDETLVLFHILPIFHVSNTFINCGACSHDSIAKVPAHQLARLTPEQRSEAVIEWVPFILKAMTIVSVVVCWVPVIGLGVALGAYLVCVRSRTRGWIRVTSLTGLVLAGLFTSACALAMYALSQGG